jgi:hypothetical protein
VLLGEEGEGGCAGLAASKGSCPPKMPPNPPSSSLIPMTAAAPRGRVLGVELLGDLADSAPEKTSMLGDLADSAPVKTSMLGDLADSAPEKTSMPVVGAPSAPPLLPDPSPPPHDQPAAPASKGGLPGGQYAIRGQDAAGNPLQGMQEGVSGAAEPRLAPPASAQLPWGVSAAQLGSVFEDFATDRDRLFDFDEDDLPVG